MENNNNNNNSVNKKKNYSKLFWSISSVLFTGIVVVGGVFAYKLITDSNSGNNNANSKDTLLFTSRDISNFINKLETNNWTEEEFDNKAESQSLKTFAQENLLANNQPVKNLISNVYPMDPVGNKQGLEVELNKETTWQYKLSPDVDPQVATFANDSLYFRNLDISFIKGVELTRLNDLYSSLNNYISNPSRKYTSSQFKLEVEDEQKNSDIKALIADKIYISETEKIPLNSIISVTFNGTQLLVKLDPFNSEGEMVKYLVESNPNMFFQNNILYVDNLKFWTDVSLSESDLNNLNVNVQNYIDQNANRYTIDEFNNQLNNVVFKSSVARYLNIDINKIGDITYNNDILTIQPASMVKFSCSSPTNMLTDNGIEIIKLKFWESFNLINLNTLYNAINSYINDANRRFTPSEFEKDINDNNTNIKDIISSNLYINNINTINQSKILGLKINNFDQLEITLDSNYNRYSIENNPNIILRNNVLVVSNLKFYKAINIDSSKLNNLQANIQDYINLSNHRFELSEFNNQLNSIDFRTCLSQSLGVDSDLLGNVNFDGTTLRIAPKSEHKFISTPNSNLIVDNNIIVKDLKFYSTVDLVNLSVLYNAIKNHILDTSKKLTSNEFKTEIKDNKELVKDLVVKNLFTSSNENINSNDILNIELNTNNELEITLNVNYVKYNVESNSNVFLRNDKLVVSNLEFYNSIFISLTNLSNLKSSIQSYIDKSNNQFTQSEFESQVSSFDFKSTVAKALGVESSDINEITYDGTSLKIIPKSMFKFMCTAENALIKDGNIIVQNLDFYNVVQLTNLDNLYDELNKYVQDPTRKFTPDEFALDIKNNLDVVKGIIADNLYIGSNTKIESDKITNISINDLDQLEITLYSTLTKYAIQQNQNITLSGNKLIVNKLKYYEKVMISNASLDNLLTNVQSYINSDDKLLTRFEFADELNSSIFKSKIASFLSITVDKISQMSYNGTYLEISPAANKKFASANNSNLIVDDEIRLEGLKFYNEVSLTNLNKIYDSISNYILDESRKLTIDEFKNEISSETSDIKTEIANALNLASSGNIGEKQISNLSVNANNELEITLDTNYIRYISQNSDNVILDKNKLIVKDLKFYTKISISDANLELMRQKIQDYINENEIVDSVDNNYGNEIFNLIQNIKTEDNQNLGTFIATPSLLSGTVTIPFKSLIKMDKKILNNIEITMDNILIKDLKLSSYNYFTWDSNVPTKITGLSKLGKKQTSITFPSEATEISSSVFANNENIVSIDMSNTKITEIPNGGYKTGLFYNCTNLKSIILPKELTSIGTSAFNGCSSLSTISIKNNQEGNKITSEITQNILPESLKNIGYQAFQNCSSLKNILLPNSLNTIGPWAFTSSGLNSISIPNSVTTIGQNAFQYCNSLTRVTLPDNFKYIDIYVFANCSNLIAINIPDSIEKIEGLAFQYSSKVKLYVSSEAMKEKVESFKLALSQFDNEIIVGTAPNDEN